MSKHSIEAMFAFPMACFGIVAVMLGLLAVTLAPLIIGKADHYFGLLNQEGEILFKGYLLSFGRMGSYGLILIFQRTRIVKNRLLVGRNNRIEAIGSAPRWIRNVIMWIYGGFGICAALAVVFGCGMMLAEKFG